MERAYFMGGDKIADQEEDVHDDVLCNRDDVGAGDLCNGDLLLVSGVEVNVVGTDTSGNAKLEVPCLDGDGVDMRRRNGIINRNTPSR